MSKKISQTGRTSCWGLVFSELPPTSSRALKIIEKRQAGFEEPVLKLLSALDSAFSKKDAPADDLRQQYVSAMAAFYKFLIEVDPKHATQFLILGDAIADLNTGAGNPLLAAKTTKSHPTRSKIRHARVYAACAIEALVAAGTKPPDAAKELLRKFPGIAKLAGPKSRNQSSKSALVKTILEWRKRLSAASQHQGDEEARLFTSGREYMKEIAELSLPEWLAGQLRRLAYELAKDAENIGVAVIPSNPH